MEYEKIFLGGRWLKPTPTSPIFYRGETRMNKTKIIHETVYLGYHEPKCSYFGNRILSLSLGKGIGLFTKTNKNENFEGNWHAFRVPDFSEFTSKEHPTLYAKIIEIKSEQFDILYEWKHLLERMQIGVWGTLQLPKIPRELFPIPNP